MDLLRPAPGDNLLEIGPGPGALTDRLRPLPWKRLVLLEKDDRFAAAHAACPLPGLEVIHADALRYPWTGLAGTWKIVGNLPYNVASPLMWDIVSQVPRLERAVFMIQKEVADRILAAPGTRAYGCLTVWMRSFVRPARGFTLGPGAFSPPPRVDSSVIVLTPLPPGERPADPAALATLIKICFQQRRKQLRGILRKAFPERPASDILDSLKIPPDARPESLSEKEFQKLAGALLPPS